MARRLLHLLHMGQPQERRCAIWVDMMTLKAAQELAELSGVDVDRFIEFVVKELHDQEAREGALRARAQGAAPVIQIAERRREAERRRRVGD